MAYFLFEGCFCRENKLLRHPVEYFMITAEKSNLMLLSLTQLDGIRLTGSKNTANYATLDFMAVTNVCHQLQFLFFCEAHLSHICVIFFYSLLVVSELRSTFS